MNTPSLRLAAIRLFLAALASEASACECDSVAATPLAASASTHAHAEAPAPVGHLLRGVIVEVFADKSALLVKHEEIPGVMRAMTMLLKVDAAVLPTVAKGQSISATLTRRSAGWWLTDVKPVVAQSSP